MDLLQPQPKPTPNYEVSIWSRIWKKWWFPKGLYSVTMARQVLGKKKYGTVLQAFNGRNPVQDAVEENLDHLAYVEQVSQEGRLPQIVCTLLQLLDIFSVWVLVTFSKQV